VARAWGHYRQGIGVPRDASDKALPRADLGKTQYRPNDYPSKDVEVAAAKPSGELDPEPAHASRPEINVLSSQLIASARGTSLFQSARLPLIEIAALG